MYSDGLHHSLLQPLSALEQHFQRIGKISEDRPRRQPGAIGDFRRRRLLVPAFDKKTQCGSAQSPYGIGFSTSHQGFSKC